LRPPLRSIELIENFLETLGSHGFTDQQIASAYRAFSSFLLGQLLLESATRGAKTSPVEVAFDEGDAQIPNQDGQADLSGSPAAARLRPLLSEDHSEEEFEISLVSRVISDFTVWVCENGVCRLLPHWSCVSAMPRG